MNRDKKLDNILNEFLSREIASTDARILSIRFFIDTLADGIKKEFNQLADNSSMKRSKLKALVHDMILIYEDEIDTLIQKRNKITEHLPSLALNLSDDKENYLKQINSHLN